MSVEDSDLMGAILRGSRRALLGGATAYAGRVRATSPAGYWKLDETSGSTAFDSSGNGHHGDYYGIVDLAATTTPLGTVCPTFDGVNDYISVAHASGLMPASALTIMAWLKLDPSAASYWVAVQKTADGAWNAGGYAMYAHNSLMRGWHSVYNSSYALAAYTGTDWTCWMYTTDGSTSWLYQDGVEAATRSVSGLVASTDALTIGYGAGGGYVTGNIAHVAVWGQVATAGMIALGAV